MKTLNSRGPQLVFAQSQRMDLTVTIGQYPLLFFSRGFKFGTRLFWFPG
ncbi:hypothetical protein NP493_2046g00001 [Ridgeia piscesae]|uniref:Uncharacterized protein n=1 Tax=Ridgeia piscesae TaxID=27915 RepID=A0AAD9JM37_RIDPI|nr:hypothetical protein NP493_2046g00001 [Ridgeia piscesae]